MFLSYDILTLNLGQRRPHCGAISRRESVPRPKLVSTRQILATQWRPCFFMVPLVTDALSGWVVATLILCPYKDNLESQRMVPSACPTNESWDFPVCQFIPFDQVAYVKLDLRRFHAHQRRQDACTVGFERWVARKCPSCAMPTRTPAAVSNDDMLL